MKKGKNRTGEMDQQLRVNIPLTEDLNLVLRIHIGGSQLVVQPQGTQCHLLTSAGSCTHVHLHTHIYM